MAEQAPQEGNASRSRSTVRSPGNKGEGEEEYRCQGGESSPMQRPAERTPPYELEVRIFGARRIKDNVVDGGSATTRYVAVTWLAPHPEQYTSEKALYVTDENETVVCWNQKGVFPADDETLKYEPLNFEVVSVVREAEEHRQAGSTAGRRRPPRQDPTSSKGDYVVGVARMRPPRQASEHFTRYVLPLVRPLDGCGGLLDVAVRLRKTTPWQYY